jgi:hypothetical protein
LKKSHKDRKKEERIQDVKKKGRKGEEENGRRREA